MLKPVSRAHRPLVLSALASMRCPLALVP